MREIKFRAFDKWKWEWVYFGLNEVYGMGQDLPNGYAKINFDKSMQYTGLKDKNGVAEVYEGDIIDTYGNIKGNIYEMDKRETDLVIQGFGTSSWEATNKEAMARGLKYSE